MVETILAGNASEHDMEQARAYSPDERKKLIGRLLGTLDSTFGEALLLDEALADIANALAQARPVLAAGLPVDQALGFTVKMVRESVSELAEAGADDTDEYEKQQFVLEKLEDFIDTCNARSTTAGEEARETIHLEYRGEKGKLESLRGEGEAGISNSIAFLRDAYGDGEELSAFLKGLDRDMSAARFIGKFGSPSFFAAKHVAAPGTASKNSQDDAEGD